MDCIYPSSSVFLQCKNIGEVVRSGGGVENGISSAGLYQTYTPSFLAVPHNATGHGREEDWIVPAHHMKMPDYKRKRISLFPIF